MYQTALDMYVSKNSLEEYLEEKKEYISRFLQSEVNIYWTQIKKDFSHVPILDEIQKLSPIDEVVNDSFIEPYIYRRRFSEITINRELYRIHHLIMQKLGERFYQMTDGFYLEYDRKEDNLDSCSYSIYIVMRYPNHQVPFYDDHRYPKHENLFTKIFHKKNNYQQFKTI